MMASKTPSLFAESPEMIGQSPEKQPLAGKMPLKKPSSGITPMMAQYFDIKRNYSDYLLFYRMGDFYELFFEDAHLAAPALDIALTHRGSHMGQKIPMCGVPAHSCETYLHRLIKKGFRVAICEQVEDPAEARKRGAKAVVRREVSRLVTAGTLTEDPLLDAQSHNYLALVNGKPDKPDLQMAWLDMTTGDFKIRAVDIADFPSALAEIEPAELLLPERLLQHVVLFELFNENKKILHPLADSLFNAESGRKILCDFFSVTTLDGFGDFTPDQISTAGALLDYVQNTQITTSPHLLPPALFLSDAFMQIDPATRRNLEIVRGPESKKEGSLLDCIDFCKTAAGSRLLKDRLSNPLMNVTLINNRLDLIAFFMTEASLRDDIQEILKKTPDLERALSRLHLGRAGPRDLATIRDSLTLKLKLKIALSPFSKESSVDLSNIFNDLGQHEAISEKLDRALSDELPLSIQAGNFIAKGYNAGLDKLTSTGSDNRKDLSFLEAQYRRETGINSLKIKHNAVLGFFIEIPSRHGEKITEKASGFILRQSTANTMRFLTAELEEKARDILESREKIQALEAEIFSELSKLILDSATSLTLCAKALARLDVGCALAFLATERNYCRPEFCPKPAFILTAGRHPTIEAQIPSDTDFVKNDCRLTENQFFWLVTGPNMAGKSTFLRQNALMAILAQSGSYVPAEKFEMGLVDRLFSRIGASDNLARGQSTFMVEMIETATILNRATENSLVILDEIGRGTATFDGLAIAWAVCEHLHDNIGCRTLFATHYHELTSLAETHSGLYPAHMRVKEWDNEIIFLYQAVSGAGGRSYGIHVAQIAGIPDDIVARARELLTQIQQEKSPALEQKEPRKKPKKDEGNGDYQKITQMLTDFFDETSPDQLSPREALDRLYQLKNLWENKT